MDFKTPSFIIDPLRERVEKGSFVYTYHNEGYFESIINWVHRHHRLQVDKDWIVNSLAVLSSIKWCIKAFSQPGGGVVIQPPVYDPFFSLISKVTVLL